MRTLDRAELVLPVAKAMLLQQTIAARHDALYSLTINDARPPALLAPGSDAHRLVSAV